MESVSSPPRPKNQYAAIFKKCIIKRTRNILSRVEQCGLILPNNILEQGLLTLEYSLKLPEAWPHTRALLLAMAPKVEQAGYRDEWMPYLEQGLDQSQFMDDIAAKAELHLQLGLLYQLRTKYTQARRHLETSAQEFEQLNQTLNQVRALNRLAYVARLQRKFAQATCLAEMTRQLIEPESPEQAFSYFISGLVSLDERNWSDAVRFSTQATPGKSGKTKV